MSNLLFENKLSEIANRYVTSYAQYDEDIILMRLLGNIRNGIYVDVGCAHPQHLSVTCAFYERGWRGINIDPRPDAIKAHSVARPKDVNLGVGASNREDSLPFWILGVGSTFDYETVKRIGESKFTKAEAAVQPLAKILDEHLKAEQIHFLKIDVEKHEKEVLEGMDFSRYRPWVLAIECTLPNSRTPCWEEWEPLLIRNGYRFALMHEINRFYIAAEKYDEIMARLQANNVIAFIRAADKEAMRTAVSKAGERDTFADVLKTIAASRNWMPEVAAQYRDVIKSAHDILEKNLPISWFSDPLVVKGYREIFRIIHPQDAQGKEKIKVKGNGYHVLLAPDIACMAISFGASPDWLMDMAKHCVKGFHFDGSTRCPDNATENLGFIAKNLTVTESHTDSEITIIEALRLVGLENSRDVVLHLNVGGKEWEFFETLPQEIIQQFSQITVKFHNFDNFQHLDRVREIFKKICTTHCPIHFHYDNSGKISACDDFMISSLVDISFARKDLTKFTPNTAVWPSGIDQPTVANRPDIHVGNFQHLGNTSAKMRANPRAIADTWFNLIHPGQNIDLDISAGQELELLTHTEESWNLIGKTEPYWSVLSNDKFLMNNVSDPVISDFYASGHASITEIQSILERNGETDVLKRNACLEFGCGLGRNLIHLSKLFPRVSGVDISEAHLAMATEALKKFSVTNCQLVKISKLAELKDLDGFDFIYSCLALQHNYPPIIGNILEYLFNLLNDEGIIIFQLPTYMHSYEFKIHENIQLNKKGVSMNAFPQTSVFDIAWNCDCKPIEVHADRYVNPNFCLSQTFTFKKQRNRK